jgi:hypothetical protein
MQPVVAVGVVGHARVVVETDNSDGDGVEGAKGIQELIWGTGGAAVQMREVLRDVNVASRLRERQEGAEVLGRGGGSTGDTDNELMGLQELDDTRYVGQTFV